MERTRMRGTVVALALGVTLLVGCGGEDPATPGGSPGSTSAQPPVGTDDPAPVTEQAVPAYYVADTESGLRLYREFHRVATEDVASDAVREMLGEPIDRDYRTLWPAGTDLAAPVVDADGLITVDLTAAARDGSGLGSAAAQAALDQLVLTVQAACQSSNPVRLLIDGEPVDELWGAVSTAEPLPRPDLFTVRSLVQIDGPADGATVGTAVTVTGEAAVFEGTLPWQVLGPDGVVVQEGITNTAEGQRFSAYSFTVVLEPGEYVVRVTEDDPSAGEGRPPFIDDKVITVTG